MATDSSASEPRRTRDVEVQRLIDRALRRDDPDTVMFARLIGAKLASGDVLHLGLARDALGALLARHFASTLSPHRFPEQIAETEHRDFVDSMRALLLRFEVSPATVDADAHCLATIIASACLRPDHLWRDLGLDGRDDVTAILTRHYPLLVARNVDGLRWKKFLARELAFDEGREPGPAPGCPGCEDFGFCYPPSTKPG